MTRPEGERLARLETMLEGIVARMDEDRTYQREQNKVAQETREDVKDRLDDLARDTKELNEWRETEVNPIIHMIKTAKGKWTGALIVFGFIGAVIIFVIRTFTDEIRGLFGAG